MLRLVSGICALGLVSGAYFVCPIALKQRVHVVLTPPEETLAEMQDGLEVLADHLRGSGRFAPDANPASSAAAE
jgi:hypothetical protein